MIGLSEYITEKQKDFGTEELVPEFKAAKDAIVKVTAKDAPSNTKNVYLKIDLWNNTLICRVGITYQKKYCVTVFKTDNNPGPNLGSRKNSVIPFFNGGKFDAFHMGGKIQYTYDSEELASLKKALEDKDADLIDKINKTIEAVDECN